MISIHGVHIEHDKWNWRGKGKRSMDIAVIGNFTLEEPTKKQLKHLSEEITKLNEKHFIESTLLHTEARRLGLTASRSLCPGTLGVHFNVYKKNKENDLLPLIQNLYETLNKLKALVEK